MTSNLPQTMSEQPFEIACGMDSKTLNILAAQVYTLLYESVFRHSIDINHSGISEIVFDISQSPTISLETNIKARDFWDAQLTEEPQTLNLPTLSRDQRSALLDTLESISLGFNIPAMSLKIHHLDGTPPLTVNATAVGTGSITTSVVNTQNTLTAIINSLQLSVSEDKGINDLLNALFIPPFINFLNHHLLDQIKIPALKFQTLEISMPVPVITGGSVIAYSALGSNQPSPPAHPPSGLPADALFVLVDRKVLQAALELPFPLGPSESFNWKIISGRVGARILEPSITSINQDGSLSISIRARAECQLTLHTPFIFPDVSFGPSADITITATANPLVKDNKIYIAFEKIHISSFHLTWLLPIWATPFMIPIELALRPLLNASICAIINRVLKNTYVPITTFPTLSFTVLNQNVNINVNKAQTASTDSMLLICAGLTVS